MWLIWLVLSSFHCPCYATVIHSHSLARPHQFTASRFSTNAHLFKLAAIIIHWLTLSPPPRSLRKGLEPALWRQATYGSMRYGFYTPIKELIAPGLSKSEMHLGHKLVAGGLSGALSSAICNPCDLVKVRMMAPGPAAVQYRWFLPSMARIAREEGVLGLWKGTGPTCARATALAAAELATYDHIKHMLLQSGLLSEGLGLHAVTAMAAGFVGALACNPFDVAKSRMMNAHAAGVTYKGMADCMMRTVRQEGVASLWKGFLPAWARVGPRVVIIFVCMEQFSRTFGQ